jgi:cysteinyl-tRNA synthetase
MAVVQSLVKSKLPPSTKKATLLKFDDVLGLDFASSKPNTDIVPDEILELAEQRHQARLEKRWQDADILREQIRAQGYEVEDTSQGSLIRAQEKRIIEP